MSIPLRFDFFAKTDVGMVRPENEDAIAISEVLQLAILADGMGGYNAGEVASGIATVTIQHAVERHQRENQYSHPDDQPAVRRLCLIQAVRKANSTIIETARQHPEYRGMGTTVVLAWFQGDCVSIAHVGDSRAYVLRNGELAQLTRDHSLVQEQISAGLLTQEQAAFAMNRNVITRAVGVEHQLVVDVQEQAVEVGDLFLLCSDGLSDRLSPLQIKNIINATSDDSKAACELLIKAANEGGGQDNISVVLIKVVSNDAQNDSQCSAAEQLKPSH
ncbi:Stp1/IreP family PP2C-type Ser/Thr phosphatase [Glaciimonas sp. Gout2]|uniref:Stp1/IreP family PP2C-type Ser/Thr phosphatase n=1 Tax=unclassified Glaciimonas TaxID=2644401 RepID=UPI002B2328B2|nr:MULTISPECIES: Stp1/IreP family PP2C-type Ser/Thr phosphatase [unclassified Glaciimonas]MEB0012759.1 Stp1/IreP family PP2C-type Ser/Thr phosphatase [Glaciimonas sp. Cout2]MEB0082237.1 Stp1/IreP family PP2C-type Ser/Thr phosphatase [Glaciimonas sp. Gout2]